MNKYCLNRREALRVTGAVAVGTGLVSQSATAQSEATGPTVYIGSSNGTMYAVDADSGKEIWNLELNNEISTHATSVEGALYFPSANGILHTVEADTGQEIDVFQSGDRIGSGPTIVDGTVYFGSWDDNLYAVDTADGEEKWSYNAGSVVASEPQVVDRTVYIGSGRNSDVDVHAVDAVTGEEQWTFGVKSDGVYSAPTAYDGTVYVTVKENSAYALDAETGDIEWEFNQINGSVSSPTVIEGTVYFGANDGSLYAVNAETGDEEWHHETNASIYSSPTVVDGTAYVGSHDGGIRAIDSSTGDQKWVVGVGNRIISSPTVDNDTVYIGAENSNLYAINVSNGNKEWQFTLDGFASNSPTVVTNPSTGDSSGSRTNLGTRGHHGSWTVAASDSGNSGTDEEPELLLDIVGESTQPGGTVTVEFTLNNAGSAEATGLQGYIDFPNGWDIGEAESFTSLGPGESESAAVELLVPESASGEYTINGSVTDDAGNEATATATITVEESSELNLAVTDATAAPGETATVTYQISNPGATAVGGNSALVAPVLGDMPPGVNMNEGPVDDGGALDGMTWYAWTVDPGETATAELELQLPEDIEPGEYGFTVEAEVESVLDSTTGTITVEEGGEPEFNFAAEASAETVSPGEQMTFEFTITNVGDATSGSYELYAAFFGDSELRNAYPYEQPFEISSRNDDGGGWDGGWLYGPGFDSAIAPGETRTPSIDVAVAESASPGEYTFALEEWSADEDPAIATVTITVAEDNTPPNAAFIVSPESPTVGDTLTFDASESNDPDGTIETYEWKVGDGDAFTPEGPEFTTELSEAGEMTVSLRVTDNNGATDTTSQEVEIGGGLPEDYLQTKEFKLSTADDIRKHSVINIPEREQVEPILSNYETAFSNGEFNDSESLENATTTLNAGEIIVDEFILNLGDEGVTDNQIAIQTAEYTIESVVSIVMVKLSLDELAGQTQFGSQIPSKILGALDDAAKELLELVFTHAITSDIASDVIEIAQQAVNNVLSGDIGTADELQEIVSGDVATVLSDFAFQAQIESGEIPPTVIESADTGIPTDILFEFQGLEDSLAYLHEQLNVGNVTPSGIEGSAESRSEISVAAQDAIDESTDFMSSLLENLDNILDEINIIGNVFEILTVISEGNLNLIDVIQLLGALIPGAGLVVAAFRAVGTWIGVFTIQMALLFTYLGVVGVADGDLDETVLNPDTYLPDVDELLSDLEQVNSVWDWEGNI